MDARIDARMNARRIDARTALVLAAIAIAAAAAAACSKEEGAADGAAAVAAGGPGARDAVLAAWKAGGLEATGMAPAKVGFGSDCQGGSVSGVDVLLCAYATPAEAAAAEAAGYEWVGSTTGAAVVAGAVLIAIADRRKADASGKTINQLMKLAPKPAAPAGGSAASGSAASGSAAGGSAAKGKPAPK